LYVSVVRIILPSGFGVAIENVAEVRRFVRLKTIGVDFGRLAAVSKTLDGYYERQSRGDPARRTRFGAIPSFYVDRPGDGTSTRSRNVLRASEMIPRIKRARERNASLRRSSSLITKSYRQRRETFRNTIGTFVGVVDENGKTTSRRRAA